jgi:transcription antitermination factor NusG
MQLTYLVGRWFAIQVKPRMEWCVSAALRNKGYEQFLPSYIDVQAECSSTPNRRAPLFPGYVFCRFESGVNGLVVTTPGVMRIVGYGDQPIPIEEEEIVALKAIMNSDIPAVPWPQLQPGDCVRITSGPLRGVCGVLCSMNTRCQFVVSVRILQRSVLVEMQRDWITSGIDMPDRGIPSQR